MAVLRVERYEHALLLSASSVLRTERGRVLVSRHENVGDATTALSRIKLGLGGADRAAFRLSAKSRYIRQQGLHLRCIRCNQGPLRIPSLPT